jgi:peptidoglycan/LPS O-acetylase OafA/YrhL
LSTPCAACPPPWLGTISYSLYLIHGVVGYRLLSVAERHTGRQTLLAGLWLVAAIALALASAWLMYRGIEAPSIRLARRLRLVST